MPSIIAKYLALSLALVAISSCRLQVFSPTGGTVASTSTIGTCPETTICDIEITDPTFLAEFTAIPRAGFEFVQWQDGNGFLCAKSTDPTCVISLPGGPFAEAVVATFLSASIMPVYRDVGVDTDGDGEPDRTDLDDDNDGIEDALDQCPLVGPDADGNGCPESNDPIVRFVVLGHAGDADATEAAVASAIETVCDDKGGCEFALYLGDSRPELSNPASFEADFTNLFETPWANLDFPFYVALGDHSPGDDGYDFWSADYVADSGKWMFPSRFYGASVGTGPTSIDIFGLDTIGIIWSAMSPQSAWLDGVVAASSAHWKLAFGHHTYISNGVHGNAGEYEGLQVPGLPPALTGEYFKNFVDDHICGNVDVYFSGHDKNLQWLQPTCGTEFIVSGAASGTTDLAVRGTPTLFETDTNAGFLLVEVQGIYLTGTFYDSNGSLLFTRTLTKVSTN